MLKPKSYLLTLLFGLSVCITPLTVSAQDDEKKDEPKPAAEEKPAEEKPAEEKPAEDNPDVKPAEEKPAEKPAEEKPADKPAEEKPAEDKPKEEKPAEKPAEKKPEEKPKAEEKPKTEEKPAEEKPAAEAELVGRTVVINLDNPTGLAVSENGDIFVASHDGIHRYMPEPNTCPLAVSGFPTDEYGKGPTYKIGPLGIAMLDANTIVVGDGSRPDGEELVRVYKIPEKHPGEWQKEDDAVYTFGPIKGGDQSARGEGNYYGVAVANGEIFVTNNGDDTKGWISKVAPKDGKWDESKLEPFIATKEKVGVDAPVPVVTATEGPFKDHLIVGQMGEVSAPGDSLLTVYDPKTGDLIAKGEMDGLNDVCGLAYSPKTKKWYATDFSWVDAKAGALYELDVQAEDGKEGEPKNLKITKKKLMSLDKPTDAVFDKDGNLYVAIFGTAEADNAEQMSPGQVLQISAEQLK